MSAAKPIAGIASMANYRRDRTFGGTWFFTVALAERTSRLLVEQIEVLRAAFRIVRHAHSFRLEAIVVLPDHLHALWTLPEGDADYPLRWRLIKSHFSRAQVGGEMRSQSRRGKGERGFWQRRYWEHVIRDEVDLRAHIDYIHFNPVKHGLVARVADWPWSSFHRYVRAGVLGADWGDSSRHDEGLSYGERV